MVLLARYLASQMIKRVVVICGELTLQFKTCFGACCYLIEMIIVNVYPVSFFVPTDKRVILQLRNVMKSYALCYGITCILAHTHLLGCVQKNCT